MLLALQILFGVLAAGTGLGLIVDVAKNRMDDLRKATGKQWASGFTVGIIANFLDTLRFFRTIHIYVQIVQPD